MFKPIMKGRFIPYSLAGIVLIFFTLDTNAAYEPTDKKDTLPDEIIKTYDPGSKVQYDLLKIFDKGRKARLKDPELAIKYYNEFYDKSEEAGEKFLAAIALFEISRIYVDRQLYFQAIDYSLRAYRLFTENHLENKSSYFPIGVGNCYFHIGNYLTAESFYRQAEKFFLRSNDHFGAAVSENNIGLVKQKISQYDSALFYFLKALDHRSKARQIAAIGHSYYYIGTAYRDLDDHKQARKYFQMAIPLLMISSDDLFLRHDYEKTMADVYFELGKLCDEEQKPSEAIANYRTALNVLDTIFEQIWTPEIYLAMGKSFIDLGQNGQAMGQFRSALRIADSAGLLDAKSLCYGKMIRLFLREKQDDSVAAYLEKYRIETDSIQARMVHSRFQEVDLAQRILESENAMQSLKERNAGAMVFMLTVGSMLLLLIVISVIYIRKQRKNAHIAFAEIRARMEAEQKLEKLNLELKEINAEKDRFISILSHDLRSPFNALLGFADLLVEESSGKDIPEIRQYSRMVQQIARNTFQLLENLLAWSRLQMGNIPFQPSKLELYPEVSMVTDSLMVNASKKSIRIRNLVSAEAVVTADSNMLQAILRNLISNAIKFTKPEGIIEIRSGQEDGFQVISVSDNGIGISAEISSKLFSEQNELVSSPGTENEKGHGLGLLLCRHMVEKNGGRIWLESTSPRGTTFSFTLPAA